MVAVRHYKLQCDSFRYDAVALCQTLLSPEGMRLIRQEYSEKGAADFCRSAINAGDWVSALGSLWSMPLKERVVLLTEEVKKGHPLICFEFAVAKFTESSTVATLVNITLPYLKVATEKVKRDCACFNDISLAGTADDLNDIYTGFVEQLSQKKCHMSLQDMLNFADGITLLNSEDPQCHQSAEKAISDTYAAIMSAYLPEVMPSPIWVYHHSESSKSGIDTISDKGWQRIRNAKNVSQD